MHSNNQIDINREIAESAHPAKKNILVLGCGDGQIGETLLGAGADEVVGVGTDVEGVTKTRLSASYCIAVNADTALPYPDEYFDVLVVTDYSKLESPIQTLAQIRRWVAKNGSVVVAADGQKYESISDDIARALEPYTNAPVASGGTSEIDSNWVLVCSGEPSDDSSAHIVLDNPWQGAKSVKVLTVPDISDANWFGKIYQVGLAVSSNPDSTMGIVLPGDRIRDLSVGMKHVFEGFQGEVRYLTVPEDAESWLRMFGGAALYADVSGKSQLLGYAQTAGSIIEVIRDGDVFVDKRLPAGFQPLKGSEEGVAALFDEGFHELEDDKFRWMNGDAALVIKGIEGRNRISFDLVCGEKHQYERFPFDVKIYVEDGSCNILHFDENRRSQNISITFAASKGDIQIYMKCDETFVPSEVQDSNDHRKLSLRFGNLQINGKSVSAFGRTQRKNISIQAAQETYTFRGRAAEPEYLEALNSFVQNPTVLMEINSRCNFHCNYCRSVHSTRQKSFMSRELFDHVLKQLKGFTTQDLRLHVDGEPTIHPEFLEMALSANRAGHRIALASNASNLKTSFLDIDMALVVNLSASPEELSTRTSMAYSRYLGEIQNYVRQWAERPNSQHVVLKVYSTAAERQTKETRQPKRAFVEKFVEDIGLTRLGNWEDKDDFYTFNYSKSPKEHLTVSLQPLAEGGLYPNLSNVPPCGMLSKPEYGFCDAPWKTLAVFSDGSVGYCCVDVTGETAFTAPDEIWKKSLKDIWLNHPVIRRERESFMEGRVTRPICRECLNMSPNREQYLFPEDYPYPLPCERSGVQHGGAM